MYVNYVESVVRQYDSEFPEEDESPVEVIAFRSYPADDQLDPEAVTSEVRKWLLDDRHTRFFFEERRKYADVGAAGSSVEFVLSLLGSAAAQIVLEQVVQRLRDRFAGGANDAHVKWFQAASTERLRDDALSAAERGLDFRRGELVVIDFDRGNYEMTLKVERLSDHQRYRVTLNADETMRVRLLRPQ